MLRPAHCYVNVKGLLDISISALRFCFFLLNETSSRGCGNCGKVGNSEWNGVEWRVFHFSTVSTAFAALAAARSDLCVSSTEKERLTAIRGTTQLVVTLSWMRPSLGRFRKPRVLCLQKRISKPVRLIALCAVEAFPGARGLL